MQKVAGAYRRLTRPDEGVLLGVSGGVDSLALLFSSATLGRSLGLRVEVATVDHGLRAESGDEAAQVAAVSARFGLAHHTVSAHLSPGADLEGRARTARYEALERVRTARGLTHVATGHTANDQAETILMRLARGTALRGAGAIRERRDTVIRPLLECTRAEAIAFVAAQTSAWVVDPMNSDPHFLRTHARDWVNAFERRVPGATRRIARFARLCADDEAYLDATAGEAMVRLTLAPGRLDLLGVRALPTAIQRRVLRALCEPDVALDFETVERMLQAVREGGTASLSGRILLRCSSGQVRLVRPVDRKLGAGAELELHEPGQWAEHEALSFRVGLARAPSHTGLSLRLGEVRLPLQVRARRRGDRVQELRRHRKLQDLLVDAKVPSEERDTLPVVCDASGEIIWVVGVWPRTPAQQGEWFLHAEPFERRASARGLQSL